MPIRENCSICKCKGFEIFSKPYESKELVNFFFNYYGETSEVKFFIDKISKNYYSLLKCEKCKFLWQKFSLSEEDQKILYDTIINQDSSFKKSLYLETKDKDYQIRELNFFEKFFKEKNEIRILDYGAGWGGWLKNIKLYYNNISALEFSENKIKILKENEIDVFSLRKLYNENITFDFIRLEQVLEHIEDLESALKLLNKISNNKSLIYISVPNSKKLFKNYSSDNLLAKGPAQPLEHLNSFTPYSLNKLFTKYNFKKISLISIFTIFVKNKKYGYLNVKYFIKLIYNYFFSTTLIFKKKL